MKHTNYLNFDAKTIVVTGSTRGIGYACARIFVEHGATVFLNGRDESVLQKAIADLRNLGFRVDGMAGDVSDERFVQRFIAYIFEKTGRIDVLINNAGSTERKNFEDIDSFLWEKEMNENLKSGFLMSRAVLPMMKAQGGGKIVNIVSTAGIHGRAGGAQYVASKSGAIGLTKALSQELGKYMITVNAIAPGLTDTDLSRRLYGQDRFNRIAETTPLGRVGNPEDVAKVALFFASPLSDFVSGQVVSVNGGALL